MSEDDKELSPEEQEEYEKHRYKIDVMRLGFSSAQNVPDEIMRAITMIQFWMHDACDFRFGDTGTMSILINLNSVEFHEISEKSLTRGSPEANELDRPISEFGYVYLIAADNGYCKIGKTTNLDKRVHDFGVKLPMSTKLIHSFKTNDWTQAERKLHEKYKSHRHHGEWFELSSDQIEEICNIKDFEL